MPSGVLFCNICGAYDHLSSYCHVQNVSLIDENFVNEMPCDFDVEQCNVIGDTGVRPRFGGNPSTYGPMRAPYNQQCQMNGFGYQNNSNQRGFYPLGGNGYGNQRPFNQRGFGYQNQGFMHESRLWFWQPNS